MYARSRKSARIATSRAAAWSRVPPAPVFSMPSRSALQPTAVEPSQDAASEQSPTPPRPSSTRVSLPLRATGLSSSTPSRPQTARRHSRIEPTQPMPMKSSTAPATRPTVPALSTRPPMSSWSEMPGTWSAILFSILSSCSVLSSAAPIAAATVISGKRARKLRKVMAAASRLQRTSSRISYACQAWVFIRRTTQGPMTGSLLSQSMSCATLPRSTGCTGRTGWSGWSRLGTPTSGYPRIADRSRVPCRHRVLTPCRPTRR